MQLKTDQVHVEKPVETMQAAPSRTRKANCWSCSLRQWYPCRPV